MKMTRNLYSWRDGKEWTKKKNPIAHSHCTVSITGDAYAHPRLCLRSFTSITSLFNVKSLLRYTLLQFALGYYGINIISMLSAYTALCNRKNDKCVFEGKREREKVSFNFDAVFVLVKRARARAHAFVYMLIEWNTLHAQNEPDSFSFLNDERCSFMIATRERNGMNKRTC